LAGAAKEREVKFCYFAIKSKYCLKVGLHDVAGEVGDDDDFCFWFAFGAGVLHLYIAVLQRAGRDGTASGRHGQKPK